MFKAFVRGLLRLVHAERDHIFTFECEQEEDGRWIAEVEELPGVMAYGATRDEAIKRVGTLVLRVLADRLEHDESRPAEALNFSLMDRECLAER